jgi:hypothetical protein
MLALTPLIQLVGFFFIACSLSKSGQASYDLPLRESLPAHPQVDYRPLPNFRRGVFLFLRPNREVDFNPAGFNFRRNRSFRALSGFGPITGVHHRRPYPAGSRQACIDASEMRT